MWGWHHLMVVIRCATTMYPDDPIVWGLIEALKRAEQTVRNVAAGAVLSPDYRLILENEAANLRIDIAKAESPDA